MGSFEYTYIDPVREQMHISESADHAPGAVLQPFGDDPVVVPAHRLAEFCGALYQAAGQPVPDLPVIADPALIDALVADLGTALPETQPAIWLPTVAALLIHAGWRKSCPAT